MIAAPAASRNRTRPRLPHFAWWLALIVAAGFALRVWYILHNQNDVIGGDGFGYHLSAADLVNGKGFINPLTRERSALHPPVWSLVLALVQLLGRTSWLDHQVFAAGVGSTTIALTALAGRRIAGDRAGLIAAGVAALYTGLWVYERPLLSESLLLPVIATTILVAYAFWQRPSTRKVVALAVLCALMALIRSEQALVVPLLLIPLIVGARSPDTGRTVATRQRVVWGALAAAVMLAAIMPWTIYNLSWLGRPIVLSDGFGNATRVANCDAVYYGSDLGHYDIRCNWGPDGPSEARSYAIDHAGRLPLVVFAREGRAWGFWAPFQQSQHDSDWQQTPLVVSRLALFEYWVLVPFALAGVIVLRRRRIAVYPLLVFFVVVVATAAITFGETRYRASAEVPIVLLAAVAVDALLRRGRPSGASPSHGEPIAANEEPRPTASTAPLVFRPASE